ncbi:MAG: VWA domain-containing protein [Vicinamibacteria bacterium]
MTQRPSGTGRTRRAGAALLALALAMPAGSWAAPQASPETPVFGVQTSSVLLDVVVRDKRGKLVRDLTAADFEVYEDNVRQTVDSFRVVNNDAPDEADAPPATAAGTPAPAPAAAPEQAVKGPAVVAFVFDRMSADARKMAHKTALTFTERGYAAGDLVGVFAIDLALRTLQSFTSNLDAIRVGFERAGTQANTVFANDRAEARDLGAGVARADIALQSLEGTPGGQGGAAAAIIAAQQASDQAQLSMLRVFDQLERDQQGYATTHGLLAVVNGLKALPGRKTIVFFSEGLAITANVQGQFRSVITSANRANVAIYTIDTGGLRAVSGTKEAREELIQASQRRLAQEESSGRGTPLREALTRGVERNEDILRLNPESGLGQLAAETGGFMVRDTNDARGGFLRITEEMRFHYVLAYAPTNEKMDGGYRSVAVKSRRPDLRIQSRKGYLALPPADYVLPVRQFEAPALVELERKPRPDAFPLNVGAYSFPEQARPGLAPVMVQIPGGNITWSSEGATGPHADFAVLVKIKDSQGREADRLSQEYRLTVPADKLEAARRGEVLFYRETDLPAGRYTAEAVAYDALAKKASVRSFPLEIAPAAPEGLRLSSLMLVSRADRLTPEEQKDSKNPLHFGEVILYPNLGVPLRKSLVPALGFYFAVYGKEVASARKTTIEVQQAGKVVASSVADLAPPDASGRIQHAGTLPIKALASGDYTLKVSVSDGARSASRSASFVVTE